MDADDDKERQALYAKTREDLLARNLSNSEKFDAAILTLSMAALGVSFTLIRGGMSKGGRCRDTYDVSSRASQAYFGPIPKHDKIDYHA